LEDDGAFASLEDVDGLLVGEALEGDAVDRQDLVAALKFAVFRGRSRLEDGLDVDGHVPVRGAEPTDDGKPEALVTSDQGDGFGGAVYDLNISRAFELRSKKSNIFKLKTSCSA